MLSPVVALSFGIEAFFPVLLTSVCGGAVCLLVRLVSLDLDTRSSKNNLLQDLITADRDRRDLVLGELRGTGLGASTRQMRQRQPLGRDAHGLDVPFPESAAMVR